MANEGASGIAGGGTDRMKTRSSASTPPWSSSDPLKTEARLERAGEAGGSLADRTTSMVRGRADAVLSADFQKPGGASKNGSWITRTFMPAKSVPDQLGPDQLQFAGPGADRPDRACCAATAALPFFSGLIPTPVRQVGRTMRRTILSMLATATLLASGALGNARTLPGSVTQFHGSADRRGAYVVPGLTFAAAARLHRIADFDGGVPGAVYAQPLFWRPPGGGAGLVIVATERDFVVALDAATGQTAWRVSLGAPVPKQATPCGNIDPLGITGTPIIDAARGALYLDAAVAGPQGPRQLVFALSLADGHVLPGWPVDVAAGLHRRGLDFSSYYQNQRGALALMDGRLFVPYGGHSGDCGPYHGWVVGLSLDRPGITGGFETRAEKGGVWAPGGVVVAGGQMYVTTGNTTNTDTWGGGEAVIALGPDLRQPAGRADYFAPANWRQMDEADLDLGGSNPVPITAGGRNMILALSKNGRGYLLDRTYLGGIGGALIERHETSWPIITAPIFYGAGYDAMVVFQGHDEAGCPADQRDRELIALRVRGGKAPAIRVAWCAPFNGRGEPISTTTDGHADRIIWVVGAARDGDGRLHGFRADTGAAVFSGGGPGDHMTGVPRFETILAAGDRLYVAGDDRVYAFGTP
jgi:hypothetical protein